MQYETFQIIIENLKETYFTTRHLTVLRLAGSYPGFQSKNRYLFKQPVWFGFGSCEWLFTPGATKRIRRKARVKRFSVLPGTQSKCNTEGESASLLTKSSSFAKWKVSNPFPSQILLSQVCVENAKNLIQASVNGNGAVWHAAATSVRQMLLESPFGWCGNELKSTLNWWSEVCCWRKLFCLLKKAMPLNSCAI